MELFTGKKVMVDYNTLQKRPDGRSGIGGVLVLYGMKRLTCNVVSANSEKATVNPEGTVYTLTVKRENVMEYDAENNTLPGVGNSMYDNRVTDLS